MTISDEQVAHDLAIAYVTAKMSQQQDVRISSHDYVTYKSAFDEYKRIIVSNRESVSFLNQNFPRKN